MKLAACVAGLKSIARCTELRLLKVGYCMDITNAGLVHIGATCKNLREFDCYRFILLCNVLVSSLLLWFTVVFHIDVNYLRHPYA